jgi:methionine-rich copper-binding protein CopC
MAPEQRQLVERLAVALVAVVVALIVVIHLLASAASPTVTEEISSPAYAAADSTLTATVRITASGPVTARSVGIDLLDSAGTQHALPGRATNLRLGVRSQTLTSQSRTLAAGSYSVAGYWQGTSGPIHRTPSRPLIITPAESSASGPLGIPGTWHLKFADDFSGMSLNTAIWRPGWFGSGVTGPATQYEQDCYDAANVRFHGDGSVDLGATPKPSSCGGSDRPYTGALLSSNPSDGRTAGGYQFTYGVVEARVHLPAAGLQIANWPAVWTDGQHWPADGEDDVMEGLDGRACFHFRTSQRGPPTCIPGDDTGWHTFASDWEPGSVTYYYDGAAVGRITVNVTGAPMYLVLAYTVSPTIGGPTVLPSAMSVDYIRVWQR